MLSTTNRDTAIYRPTFGDRNTPVTFHHLCDAFRIKYLGRSLRYVFFEVGIRGRYAGHLLLRGIIREES